MPSYKTSFGSFLKSEDLAGREVRVVIGAITTETIKGDRGDELKLIAHFVGKDKGMVLNKTNAESIAAISGSDDTDDWPGTQLILWVDPNVTFGGKKVPAIRIKAAAQRVPQQRQAAPPPPPPAADDAPPMTDDDIPF